MKKTTTDAIRPAGPVGNAGRPAMHSRTAIGLLALVFSLWAGTTVVRAAMGFLDFKQWEYAYVDIVNLIQGT